MKAKEKAIKYLNKKEWWFPSDIDKRNKEVRTFNHALDIAIKEAQKEVFELYLTELKRIKPQFKDEPTKTVIQQLIYFTYNRRRELQCNKQ